MPLRPGNDLVHLRLRDARLVAAVRHLAQRIARLGRSVLLLTSFGEDM